MAYKVIDENGNVLFNNTSAKTCMGYADKIKKNKKNWIYLADENGNKMMKF